jgi:hypothetical protein
VLLSLSFLDAYGMIDSVFVFVITTTCAVTIAVYRGEYLCDQFERATREGTATPRALDLLLTAYSMLLKRGFQAWLAFGAALGVAMSILFRAGYQGMDRHLGGLEMLLGFIGISVGLGYWVFVPLANGLLAVHEEVLRQEREGAAAA